MTYDAQLSSATKSRCGTGRSRIAAGTFAGENSKPAVDPPAAGVGSGVAGVPAAPDAPPPSPDVPALLLDRAAIASRDLPPQAHKSRPVISIARARPSSMARI